jgi:hypothetical protein
MMADSELAALLKSKPTLTKKIASLERIVAG